MFRESRLLLGPFVSVVRHSCGTCSIVQSSHWRKFRSLSALYILCCCNTQSLIHSTALRLVADVLLHLHKIRASRRLHQILLPYMLCPDTRHQCLAGVACDTFVQFIYFTHLASCASPSALKVQQQFDTYCNVWKPSISQLSVCAAVCRARPGCCMVLLFTKLAAMGQPIQVDMQLDSPMHAMVVKPLCFL